MFNKVSPNSKKTMQEKIGKYKSITNLFQLYEIIDFLLEKLKSKEEEIKSLKLALDLLKTEKKNKDNENNNAVENIPLDNFEDKELEDYFNEIKKNTTSSSKPDKPERNEKLEKIDNPAKINENESTPVKRLYKRNNDLKGHRPLALKNEISIGGIISNRKKKKNLSTSLITYNKNVLGRNQTFRHARSRSRTTESVKTLKISPSFHNTPNKNKSSMLDSCDDLADIKKGVANSRKIVLRKTKKKKLGQ